MAVRAAASLCVHLAHAGGCALLLPGERRPVEIGRDLGAWPALHARLAVVEAGAAPQGGALVPRAGAVLWVTGADLNRAPRTLQRLPAAARFVVSPTTLPRGARGVHGRRLHRAAGRSRRQRDAGGRPRERRRRAPAGRAVPAAPTPRRARVDAPRSRRESLAAAPARVRRARALRRRALAHARAGLLDLADAARRRARHRRRGGARAARPAASRRRSTRRRGAGSSSSARVGVAVVTFLAGGRWPTGLEARLLLPGALGRAVRRARPRPRGRADRRVALHRPDEWIALSILLGAPVLVTLAALLAFWPARRGRAACWRRRARRAAGALRPAGDRARARRAAAARPRAARPDRGLAVAAAPAHAATPGSRRRSWSASGSSSLPAAAALDSGRPWWNYGGVSWFGDGKQVAFDWTHRYGPMDWPRDGTTLLNVKSDRPHYWKAESLDVFDGFRWARAGRRTARASVPTCRCGPRTRTAAGTTSSATRNGTSVRASRCARSRPTSSSASATTYAVNGVGAHRQSSGDGTIRARSRSSAATATRSRAYAPDPSAAQMRGVAARLSGRARPRRPRSCLPRERRERARRAPAGRGDAGRRPRAGRPVAPSRCATPATTTAGAARACCSRRRTRAPTTSRRA